MKINKSLFFSLIILVCAVLAGTVAIFAVWTVKKEATNQITIADIVVDLKNADTDENLTELIVDGEVQRLADESGLPDYADYDDVSAQNDLGFAAGGRFKIVRDNALPVSYELSIVSSDLVTSGYSDKLYIYLYDVTDYAVSGAEDTDWSGIKISALPQLTGLIGNSEGTKSEIVYELFVFCVDNTLGNNATVNFPLTLSSTLAGSQYELLNGGFEYGMLGWTITGEPVGGVSDVTNYWIGDAESAEGYPFNKDGDRLFSAYADGILESSLGYLTSSQFTIGGNGFMTFKLGGAKNSDKVYIDIIEATTGNILARYGNSLWQEYTSEVKTGCTLIPYKADLSGHLGKTAYIRITDNATSDYGLFFVDSFITYYESEPDSLDFNTAVTITAPTTIYEILNGGFEDDMTGWTVTGGAIGGISSDSTYWDEEISFDKDGDKFFSAYATGASEDAMGTLTSAQFTIGGIGYMSFKLGAAQNSDLVYLEVIDVATGTALARYGNSEHSTDNLSGCKLIGYKADLSEYVGKTVYIKFTDNATQDYGLIFTDSFVTYYEDTNGLPDYYEAVQLA